MKKEYEEQYHSLEEKHWWFLGRRHLVRQLVLQSNADRNCRILEIGCSGGPLIQQLHADGYANITGIDISAEAIALSRRRGLRNVHVMDAQNPTFPDESFDLITASDVLEHLSDAPRALREWHRLLRPGGVLIVFVPAFMFLWTAHDEVNKHFQRYRRDELNRLIEKTSFDVRRSSYWIFLLFFPVALVRSLRKLFPVSRQTETHGDLNQPPAFLNQLLFALLRFENHGICRGINWPFGLSAMTIAHKPNDLRKPHVTE